MSSASSADVNAGDAYAGGLVGIVTAGGIISGSSASGFVSVSGMSSDPASLSALAIPLGGGLVGLMYGYKPDGVTVDPVVATNSYATGGVGGGGGSWLGGFVGYMAQGGISTSYATGYVNQTAGGQNGESSAAGGFAGGLGAGAVVSQAWSEGGIITVGSSGEAIPGSSPPSSYTTVAGGFVGFVDPGATATPPPIVSQSYALGSVSVTGATSNFVGGFAGDVFDGASADHVYATGSVSASGGFVGGLVGVVSCTCASVTSGSISDSYWDEGTTSQTVGYYLLGTGSATNIVGLGGSTGLSPYASASYANFDLAGTWYLIEGQTRPILRSEHSTTITNAHQLQLMALDPTAAYTLGSDIDANETTNPSGVWNTANGFVPVGGNGAANFTGNFDGQGHTISNLTIVDTTPVLTTDPLGNLTNGAVGLFGVVGATGTIENVSLANAEVTGGDGTEVGALIGVSAGSVSNASASGAITTGSGVTVTSGFARAVAGGLIGSFGGAVDNSNASTTVTGANAFVGGLAGEMVNGEIIGSFATGSVGVGAPPPADLQGSWAGGLVGQIRDQTGPVANVTLSYATGDVTGAGGTRLGGFAGLVEGAQISTSYATGAITQTAAGVNDTNWIGGFAAVVNSTGSIETSWAGGAVSSVEGSVTQTIAGGFAGIVNGGTVSTSYSLGSVAVTGEGSADLGGFAGNVGNNATIDHVYATGVVTGSGIVGGLVGDVGGGTSPDTSSISDSYWDEGTIGQTTGFTLETGATATNITGIGGQTGLSPYASATYASFDLANTWFLIEGETRPILRAEYSTSITDAHQLQLMELNLTASYALANNIDASETTNPAGVWNPANGFVPVSNPSQNSFTGSFDGQGHSISDLTIIAGSAVARPFLGLFGSTSDASIANVILANVDVVAAGSGLIGALVAHQEGGTITNASSSGVVTDGSTSTGGADVGGLVGYIDSGSITDSSSSAAVTGGDARAGGLVGSLISSTIANSFATGTVTVSGNVANEGTFAGGLVAWFRAATGEAPAILTGSYATGNVIGGGGSVIGGLVGEIGETINLGPTSVQTSFATGSVTQTAGAQNGQASMAGGFAGQINGASISQSFAMGTVTTLAAPSSAPNTLAGGFVGDLASSGTISESYATGSVTVTGGTLANVGGFAGMIEEGASITHVYAAGQVSGAQGEAVGGLVGQVGNPLETDTSGSLTNSVWDTQATGQAGGYTVAGTGTVSGVTGLTTAQMQDGVNYAANFPGWDFVNTWSVPSQGFYPELYGASHVLRININDITYEYGTFPIYSGYFTGIQAGEADSFTWNINNFSLIGATQSTTGYLSAGVIQLTSSQSTASDDAGDYRIVQEVGGTLTVTPRPLAVSLSGTAQKVYDGTTVASTAGLTFTAAGVIGYDVVSLGAPADASYDTKDVGTGKLVTASNFALTGADAADYSATAPVSAAIGTITPASLTASLVGTTTRTYDGTTTASLTSGNYSLSGVIGGDSVALNDPATGVYAGKDVGSYLTVSVSGLALTGASAGDYTVNPSASGAIGFITPASLAASLVGPVTKTYDQTTAATLSPGNYSLSGVIGADVVALNNPPAGTYDTPDAGTGKTVTVTGLALTGTDAVDYTVNPSASGAVGVINPLAITASLIGGVTKTYDGTTLATLAPGNYSLLGVLGDDSVSLNNPTSGTYDTKDVGTGKLVTVGGLALIGASAGDYTVNPSASAPIGVINPLAISASLTGVVDKTYDGTTAATLGSGAYALSGVIAGDTVSLTAASGAYDTKDVGTGKTVTFTGLGLTGADALDYTVYPAVSGAVGQIDPLVITASLIGSVTKTYDGTVAATLAPGNYSLTGVLGDDSVGLNNPAAGTYDTKDVGTGKVVTVGGLALTGASAGDYSVNGSISAPIGVINPATLTASLVGSTTKTYDGTTTAGLTSSNYSLSGVIGGDVVALDDPATGAYAGKDVGSYLIVSVSGLALTGASASDYAVNPYASGAIGFITPASLTASLTGSVTKTYDKTTAATLSPGNYSLTGIIGADVVALNNPTAGTYDTPDAGAGKTVTVTGLALTGTDAFDYTVNGIAAGAVGTINPLAITAALVGTTTKTYDGTTTASLTPGNYDLSGVIGGDSVALNDPATGVYAGKDVGSYLTVSVSGLALTGASAGDYTVNPSASGAIGFITPASLAASLVGPVTKTYDQTTAATLSPGNYSLSGVIGADVVALNNPTAGTYDTPDAGTGKTVTVTGLALTGTDAVDYTVNPSASGAVGVINPLAITASLIGGVTKTYDGTTLATLAPGNYSLLGVLGDDSVSLNNPTSGTYDTKDVGTGKLVTVGGLALIGASAGDYTVNPSASAPIGVINPLAISASLTGVVDKTYDGTTAATLGSGAYALSGVIAGDTVSLTAASGAYDTKDVGTGKTVTFTGLGLTGADALDYTVSASVSAAIGEIDRLALVAGLVGPVSKAYDGNTHATLTAANYSLTGVISGDAASLNDPTSGSYDTAAIGTGKLVTVTGVALTGADAGNYSVATSLSGPVGVITAAASIYNPVIPTILPQPQLTPPDAPPPGPDTPPAGPDTGAVGPGASGGPGGVDGLNPVFGPSDTAGPGSDFAVPIVDTLGAGDNPAEPGAAPETGLPGTGQPATSLPDTGLSGAAGKTRTQTASVFPVGKEGRGPHTGIDTSPVTGAGNHDLWTGVDESEQACNGRGGLSPSCGGQGSPSP